MVRFLSAHEAANLRRKKKRHVKFLLSHAFLFQSTVAPGGLASGRLKGTLAQGKRQGSGEARLSCRLLCFGAATRLIALWLAVDDYASPWAIVAFCLSTVCGFPPSSHFLFFFGLQGRKTEEEMPGRAKHKAHTIEKCDLVRRESDLAKPCPTRTPSSFLPRVLSVFF